MARGVAVSVGIGVLMGVIMPLLSSWWPGSQPPSVEREILAQVRDLLAENARLRELAQAVPSADATSGSPVCPASCLSVEAASAGVDGLAAEVDPAETSWIAKTLLLGMTVAFFGSLLYRLYTEWRCFELVKSSAPLAHFARYRLDLWVSTTACWQEQFLIIASTGIVLLGGWLYHWTTGSALSQSMSTVWIFLVDTGAHGDLTDTAAWMVALLVTILGMLVFALLISVLTERLQQFLEAMRKGHSRVICSGHVLILGWSDKIPTIIEELAEANSSEGGGTVVILSEDKEKTEMEEEIQFQLDNSQSVYRDLGLRGTKWVCRSGNPMLISDLRMVSVERAKAIIILVDNNISSAAADEKTLRTLLGLAGLGNIEGPPTAAPKKALPPLLPRRTRRNSSLVLTEGAESDESPLSEMRKRFWEGSEAPASEAPASECHRGPLPHIVVELTDIDSVPLVEALGNQKTEIIVGHDMAGQLLIQGSREEGLSRVYETIVGFSGPEFYIEEWPELVGRTFGEVAFSFATAVPCGLVHADGELDMNPPSSCCVQHGDRIVVLAEDNDTYRAEKEGALFHYVEGTHRRSRQQIQRDPEHILICGWRRDLGDMIRELEAAVEQGSSLTLMSTMPLAKRDQRLGENCRDAHCHLKNLELKHCEGDPTFRKDLEQLPLQTYDSVIIVADEELESNACAMAADGKAIATMLLCLDIRRSRPQSMKSQLRVTSELRDTRTRNLVQATGLSDYVMSQNIIASTIANVAESHEVNGIMREILTSRGNSLYLRPSSIYLSDPLEEVSFWELSARLRDYNEILLGHRIDDEVKIVINPEEDRSVAQSWDCHSLIVLARDPRPGR